jgi:hypothetical protein
MFPEVSPPLLLLAEREPDSLVFRPLPGGLFGRLLGYLDTGVILGKRLGEVIFSYSFSSECYLFHAKPQTTVPKGARNLVGSEELTKTGGFPTISSELCSSVPSVVAPAIEGSVQCEETHRRRTIRSNVMTPESNPWNVPGVYWYPRNQLKRPFRKGRKTYGRY